MFSRFKNGSRKGNWKLLCLLEIVHRVSLVQGLGELRPQGFKLGQITALGCS